MSSKLPISTISPALCLIVCVGGVLALAGWWTSGRQNPADDDNSPPSPLQLRLARIERWVARDAEAVPELREILRQGDARERRDAMAALQRIGPSAAAALPEVEQCLDSPETSVREVAHVTVSLLGVDLDRLLPRLAEGLKDSAREVRWSAARALEEAPDEVVFRLADQPGTASVPLRVERIRRLGPVHAGDLELLHEILGDSGFDDVQRAECFELLIWHDQVSREDLLATLRSSAFDLNSLGVQYLENTRAPAGEAAPDLAEKLRSPAAATHMVALRGLRMLVDDAGPTLPAIEEYLYSERCVDIPYAALIVAELGGDRARLAERLSERILEGTPGQSLAPALVRIDPGIARRVIDSLAERIGKGVGDTHEHLENLRNFGPAAESTVPLLRRLVKDRDGEFRRDAMQVLSALGAGAKPALPEVLQVLNELARAIPNFDGISPVYFELATIWACAGIGSDAQEAVPLLLQRYPQVKEEEGAALNPARRIDLAILDSLARIAPNNSEVQGLFEMLARDAASDTRGFACLGRIAVGEPSDEVLADARAVLLEPLDSNLRPRLIARLIELTGSTAETIEVLTQMVEQNQIPLSDRLVALEGLAKIGPEAVSACDRLNRVLERPPGRFPGPSRPATNGAVYGDRYKPAVRDRLAMRNWIRFALRHMAAKPNQSESGS